MSQCRDNHHVAIIIGLITAHEPRADGVKGRISGPSGEKSARPSSADHVICLVTICTICKGASIEQQETQTGAGLPKRASCFL